MGLFSDLLGRSKPRGPDLDSLFHLPSAAVTLQTSLGLLPTGDGAVCYRAASGPAFAQTQEAIVELLGSTPSAPGVRLSDDSFGFSWLEVDHPPFDPVTGDLGALCTDLHAVNTTLEAAGFGPALLCSLVPFLASDGQPVGLVYLYKQGTYYPFAPVRGTSDQRDNLLERQLRDALARELPMEQDLSRWLALWGAPGLESH